MNYKHDLHNDICGFWVVGWVLTVKESWVAVRRLFEVREFRTVSCSLQIEFGGCGCRGFHLFKNDHITSGAFRCLSMVGRKVLASSLLVSMDTCLGFGLKDTWTCHRKKNEESVHAQGEKVNRCSIVVSQMFT